MKLPLRLLFSFICVLLFFSVGKHATLTGSNVPLPEVLTAEEQDRIAQTLATAQIESLEGLLTRYHKYLGFHGNVLVGYKGRQIFKKSIGTADFRTGEALTDTSAFQLASVSKQFTAMAIMLLKKEGRLHYNDHVKQYIPELPYDNMTIRQLLNHSAGLPNYMWLIEHKWNKETPPTNEQAIGLIQKHEPNLYFTPGRRWDYSNTGYMLLASIVERVSGQLFADFIEENIFRPLGMDHSFVYSAALERDYPDKLSGFYYRFRRRYGFIDETLNDGTVGDKNVYSTIEDLLKWERALYTDVLVPQNMLEEAFTKGRVNRNRFAIPYGFGFRLKTHKGKKLVYHHGVWNGFRTALNRYVEDSLTIIMLNHTTTGAKSRIINRVEDIFEKPSTFQPTYALVQLALEQGAEAALGHYHVLADTQQQWIAIERLPQLVELLETMDKPQSAQRLQTLYEGINTMLANRQMADQPAWTATAAAAGSNI